MAKQLAKLSDFFEGRRREYHLEKWEVLEEDNVKRIKLSVSMPLSRKPVLGMPDPFSEPYIVAEKEQSSLNLGKIDVIVESAKFEIYSTDTIDSSTVACDGATLQGFRMVGEGVKDKRRVSLEFVVYLPGTIPLRDWCWDHTHATFFAETVPMQAALPVEEPVKQPTLTETPKKKGKPKELVN